MNMKTRFGVGKFSSGVNRVVENIASVLLALMLLLILVQIVGRYFVQNPLQWTEEAARYCMVWCGLLGASCALFHRADPRLTEGLKLRSDLGSWTLRSGRWVAIMIFVLPWLIYGPGFVGRHYYRFTDALDWNSAIVVAVIPIAAVLLILHACQQFSSAQSQPEPADAAGSDSE